MKINDNVLTYDNNLDNWVEGTIVNIRRNVACCSGTEAEHFHDILYDVMFNGKLSKGHLPHSLRCKIN